MFDTNTATLYVLLLLRLNGFFLLSPLFRARGVSPAICFGVACATALLLAPPLSAVSHPVTIVETIPLLMFAGKELCLGYLLGFFLSLLFEGAAFAGQFVGTLIGFSATELFDPASNASQPILSRFYSLALFVLFLCPRSPPPYFAPIIW